MLHEEKPKTTPRSCTLVRIKERLDALNAEPNIHGLNAAKSDFHWTLLITNTREGESCQRQADVCYAITFSERVLKDDNTVTFFCNDCLQPP